MVNKDVCSALSLHVTLLTETQGTAIQEPFRCSLRSVVQWYDVLQVKVDQRIKASLQVCCDCIRNIKVASLIMPTSAPPTPVWHSQFMTLHCPSSMIRSQGIPPTLATASSSSEFISSNQSLTPGCCASILIQHCPVCFGGDMFGWPIPNGGDIHVATNGNFHHWHHHSAGNSPSFYDPAYFLSKGYVDAMGAHIKKQRKKPHKICILIVPDEATDLCKTSYQAADEKKPKASMNSFDDTGLMTLICCHDVLLFFANIDSPRE